MAVSMLHHPPFPTSVPLPMLPLTCGPHPCAALQAVAQLCISGVQQAQQEHRAEQQQQRRASGSMGGHVPAAVAAGAPAGGLQELAAALGTWDHRADPTMATLQQQ